MAHTNIRILLIFIISFFSCNDTQDVLVPPKQVDMPAKYTLQIITKGSARIVIKYFDDDKLIEIICNKPILSAKICNKCISLDNVVNVQGACNWDHEDSDNERHILNIKYIEDRESLTKQIVQLLNDIN